MAAPFALEREDHDAKLAHGNDEKLEMVHGANGAHGGIDAVESGRLTSWEGVSFTEQDTKRAKRKIDLYLVGTLTLYFFLSFLDRTNFGNARVAGMLPDLGINPAGPGYNQLLCILFVPYILCEFPVSALLKRVGPNPVLPILAIGWGLCTMVQGWVTNFAGLAVCRFLIGAFEGGLTPGMILCLSLYVPKYALQKRTAVVFGTITLAGAFSGLIAYAITKNLSGTGGHAGWRWIFWLEGGASMVFACIGFITLPKSPSTIWWLKPAEKAAFFAYMHESGMAYVEAKDEKVNFLKSASVIWTNPMVFLTGWLTFFSGAFVFALTYYVPPIVASLGWDTVKSQLMTVPPNAVGYVVALVTAIYGDRLRSRGVIVVFLGVVGTAGFVMQLVSADNMVRYGAFFPLLACQGAISSTLAAWCSNNASPSPRRAIALPYIFSMTNVMGIASVWTFVPSESPRYKTGSQLGVAAGVFIAVISMAMMGIAYYVNKSRDRKFAALKPGHQFPDAPMDDRDIRFRYTY